MTFLFRLFQLAFPMIPIALFEIAFQFPRVTDRVYSRGVYPWVVSIQSKLFGSFAASVAERSLAVVLGLLAVWVILKLIRHKRDDSERLGVRRLVRWAIWSWFLAGMLFFIFLVSWGFNYARGSLAGRMNLPVTAVTASEVIALGAAHARRANDAYREAGFDPSSSRAPLNYEELNHRLDLAFATRRVEGDPISAQTIPAKPLDTSLALSYLGVSGIYIPFTGEPSVNGDQPSISIPHVAAHEKAHQHGITNEGEASFVAFLVTTDAGVPAYVRYSGYLTAASRLLSEATRYGAREELEKAWGVFDEGPREDLQLLRDYWQRFEGPAADTARRVNDRYLETMRVPGGVESYNEVVELLVAWERASRQR